MTRDRSVSDTTLLLAGIAAFGLLAVATALLSPAVVRRFYPLGPDTGASWYFRQLPNPTALTRVTFWTGYAVHQLVIWAVLFMAMRRTTNSQRFNTIALSLNVAFVALHLVQTCFRYDGPAQDVPIRTSQGSGS